MAQRPTIGAAAPPRKARDHRPSQRHAAPRVILPKARLAHFCRRWKITELALFGSALTDRFRAGSDIDLMATFAPDVTWTLLDQVRMQIELSQMLGRRVELLNREGVEASRNPIRRQGILESAKVVYAA